MELAAKHDAFLKLQPDLSSYEKLTSVGGGEFDKLYTAEAQRLNQEAIDQLKPLMGQLTASDVKAFAEDDLKDDQKHLQSAQDLAAKLQKD
jgi:predicted outer membrane protein